MPENTFGYLFSIIPPHWDYRGSPYLWEDMKQRLQEKELPNNFDETFKEISCMFVQCTDKAIDCRETFGVQKYAKGGMSSGGITADFWNTKIKSFLQRNFQNLKSHKIENDVVKEIMRKENKDIIVFMFSAADGDVYFLYNSNDKAFEMNLPVVLLVSEQQIHTLDYFDVMDDYLNIIGF